MFNACGPLLKLRCYVKASELLLACRAIFERENSVEMIGKALSVSADLESNLGHFAEAKSLEEAALRFHYVEGGPVSIGNSHFNLANFFIDAGERRGALAHRLAAAIITVASSSGDARRILPSLRLTFVRGVVRRSRWISTRCARSSSRSMGCGLAN